MIWQAVDPSPWTMALAVFVVTMCVTAVSGMDHFLPVALGGALPVVGLAAVGVNVAGLTGQFALARLAPGRRQGALWSLADWSQGVILAAGAGLFLSMWVTRQQSTLLSATPRLVILLAAAAVALYTVILGFESTVRLTALVGVLAVPVLFGLAATMPANAHWDRLLAAPPTAVDWRAVAMLLFAPRGFVIANALAGPRARRVIWPSIVMGAASGLIMVLFLVLPGLVLGPELASMYTYPFYETTATVRSIYVPLHEGEYVVDVVWQMIASVIVATYSAAALRSFGIRGPLLRPGWALAVLSAAVVLIAVPAMSQQTQATLFFWWSTLGFAAFFLLPAAAYVASHRTAPVPA